MLTFRDVVKTFPGGASALRGVSLEVAQGDFCVLLGASGSGKTTLLRTVNGLVAPTRGAVTVDGEAVTKASLPKIRRRIAMVHQQLGLVERLSVAQNVLSGAAPATSVWRCLLLWHPRAQREKACALVARVGLSEQLLLRRAGLLSGGEQQRVAIARALMLDPRVILADEPVASLDPKTARSVLALIREAARERGATVLCSLHQPDLARAFADRIVGMRRGEIIFDGPPDSLDARALQQLYDLAAPGEAREAA
jgi:phosphonate transport system ATP-binding protein